MSWLTKVSNIAERAEELLNQIDQNAAVALKNTKKSRKNGSAVMMIDVENQDSYQLEKSQIMEASISKHRMRPSYAGSLPGQITNGKKEYDDLVAFLNNSNDPTSSRCSSVTSRFSAPSSQNACGVVAVAEGFVNEEDLKAQYSDALKCLHMKESQITVMRVRLQEVEEANIKKDAQIAELIKDMEVLRKRIGAQDSKSTNEQPFDLKKLQRERDKEKEMFEKREREFVERLEASINENIEIKKEMQDLRRKLLKMEMSEQSLTEEIRLAKYNLEANKQEFDEYKQRAQKILASKENLLVSLKENAPNGSEKSASNVELEELRCERDLLKEDLQQSQFLIYNLKGDIQNRLRDEQRASGAQRENLLEQVHKQMSQANQYREQMERTQLEYEFLQAEMRRQEEAVEKKLAEKEAELIKLMEEKKGNRRYEIGEMEQKISLLSEKLIVKQTAIERLESEKRALELRLERSERACRNAEAAAIKTVAIEMRENGGTVTSDQSILSFRTRHSDNIPIRIAKLGFGIIDSLGLRLAVFMRSQMFRFFFLMYCILLHVWVLFILFTYTPEIHPL